MSLGTVKWFDSHKGFGYITWENGGMELYVDHSQITDNVGEIAVLTGGQCVEFTVGQGEHGPCANNVRQHDTHD